MVVIVVCGPIASGKSTVARAVARLFQARRTEAAAIDLDLVYEMLEHHGAPRKNNRATWSRARRAAAALTDALLEDGVTVVIMEGEFMSPLDRGEFSSALRSAVLPVFVTIHVSIDRALQRVEADATRGVSRDPDFLRGHYKELERALHSRPATDLVVDTGSVSPEEAARMIAEWAAGHAERR